MLSPYRVLDLSDETGLFCGKLLGDLGADVIKIERPGGDPARRLGPFYHDEPDAEKSLFWFAFNTNKRGITLDIESADGQEIFRKLVRGADLVIETFAPGYLDKLGLGYSELEKINPGLIMVSITPFGQTGPWKDYKAPDIVAWAVSGEMYVWGDADRPPVRISHHSHAHIFAGLDAAVGAVTALFYRGVTGEGQQINASILDSMVQTTSYVTDMWGEQKKITPRPQQAAGSTDSALQIKQIWPCKDGLINCRPFAFGPQSKERNLAIVSWIESEGFADDFLKGFNWDTFGPSTPQEVIDRLEAPTGRLFQAHTKAELFDAAAKYADYNLELYPVATAKEVLENVQFAARQFFVQLEHPELGVALPYPAGFAKTTKAPPQVKRRAPLIGEHNLEIYEKEMGISRDELGILKQSGVI